MKGSTDIRSLIGKAGGTLRFIVLHGLLFFLTLGFAPYYFDMIGIDSIELVKETKESQDSEEKDTEEKEKENKIYPDNLRLIQTTDVNELTRISRLMGLDHQGHIQEIPTPPPENC
jgi:hypothetical protein